MKNILFIDANIYLRLFDTASGEMPKLLDSLLDMLDSIFVTEQIATEVGRKKLHVASTSFNDLFGKYRYGKITLPEQYLSSGISGEQNDLSGWNKKNKEIQQQQEAQSRALKDIFGRLIFQISENNDRLSTTLERIFSQAKKPSPEEIDKARIRKEFGNPPGKRNDPLGDQISWEQLLSVVDHATENVWLVTSDSDYCESFGGSHFLNPYLRREILARGAKQVKVFDKLNEALRSWNATVPKAQVEMPDPETMERIDIAETGLMAHFPHMPPYEVMCPICQAKIENMVLGLSRYGGWSYHLFCPNCGPIDTGEQYTE